jgi:hypothetical protein
MTQAFTLEPVLDRPKPDAERPLVDHLLDITLRVRHWALRATLVAKGRPL